MVERAALLGCTVLLLGCGATASSQPGNDGGLYDASEASADALGATISQCPTDCENFTNDSGYQVPECGSATLICRCHHLLDVTKIPACYVPGATPIGWAQELCCNSR